jgi:predicted enzyme related to lactoylglutathione lyase
MFVAFAMLKVTDQDRAKKFYVENLGCDVRLDQEYEKGGWRWIEVGFPDTDTTIHFEKRTSEVPSDGPDLVIVTKELDGLINSLKSKGVEIINDPKKAPWNSSQRFAEFRDSEGNRIVLRTS